MTSRRKIGRRGEGNSHENPTTAMRPVLPPPAILILLHYTVFSSAHRPAFIVAPRAFDLSRRERPDVARSYCAHCVTVTRRTKGKGRLLEGRTLADVLAARVSEAPVSRNPGAPRGFRGGLSREDPSRVRAGVRGESSAREIKRINCRRTLNNTSITSHSCIFVPRALARVSHNRARSLRHYIITCLG